MIGYELKSIYGLRVVWRVMYEVYHHSRFFTRFFVRDESKSNRVYKLKKLIDNYNKYHSINDPFFEHVRLEHCTVIKHGHMKQYPVLATITLFCEFSQLNQLKKRICQLPFPKGLQVRIEQAKQSIKDGTNKKNPKNRRSIKTQKYLDVYQNNIKIFFKEDEMDKTHSQFARGVAKWLMINPNNASKGAPNISKTHYSTNELNVKCEKVMHGKIILRIVPANTTLTKGERWGELFTKVNTTNVLSVVPHSRKLKREGMWNVQNMDELDDILKDYKQLNKE